MMDENAIWQASEAIFHDALAVAEPERTALLTARCGGDATLMAELRSLLAACAAEETHRQSLGPDGVLPGASIGHYVIDSLIGRGGMGAVYRAHRSDGQFEQQVAIKIVDMPLASDFFRERFRAERQMLAGLAHPYIARLLDGGVTEAGELYLVMEYIDGQSMTLFCTQRNLSLEDRLRLFMKVCEAVQYAHRNLIVHRDLKPENILVLGDSTPRLLDFGTAKIIQPLTEGSTGNATRSDLRTFTPRYASPEQVLERPISIASDIYSLGVLLYLLLTGQPPYELANYSTEELVRVICHEQPPRPSLMAPPSARLDRDIDSIVMKALRKDPRDRYTTVEAMAADLQAFLDHRPVGARRGSLRYLAGKFAQRNRTALLATFLIVLLVALALTGVVRQTRVAYAQRRMAEARASNLRQLSQSMLSEIDDAIRDLPGSTGAQHLLVSRVVEHLNQLSRDEIGDSTAEVNLINAYVNLAGLQGNPYHQNIGDTQGALASLEKAVALAETARAADPENRALLKAQALAEHSRSQILFGQGRESEAVRSLTRSIAMFDHLVASAEATPEELEQTASAYNTQGDFAFRRGHDDPGAPSSSIAQWRKDVALSQRALTIDPHFDAALRRIAVSDWKMGAAIAETDPEASLAACNRSIDDWHKLPPSELQTTTTRKGMMWTYQTLGYALTQAGRYKEAVGAYEVARALVEPLAKADPKDTWAQSHLAFILLYEGWVYVDMRDPALYAVRRDDAASAERAMRLYRSGIDILDTLLRLDGKNVVWLDQDQRGRVMLGKLLQLTGAATAGERMTEAAIATLHEAANTPDAPMVILLGATAGSLIAPASGATGKEWTLANAERLSSLTDRKNPRMLLLLAMAANDAGHNDQARQAAKDGLALLSPAQPGVPEARNRILLRLALDGRTGPHPF